MPRSGRDMIWSEALEALARTERLNRDAFRPTATGWEPPVDVLETEAGLLVVIALPGVRRDDMEIVIGHGELLVRGTRRWPRCPGRLGCTASNCRMAASSDGCRCRRAPSISSGRSMRMVAC